MHKSHEDADSSQLKGKTNNQNVFSQNQQRVHKRLPVVFDAQSIEQVERKIDSVVKSHINVDKYSPIKKMQTQDEGSLDQTFDDDPQAMEQRIGLGS